MSVLVPPPENAPAEEWGRFAVSIPGWRWWWEHDKRRPYGLPGYRRRPGSAVWEWVPDVSECSMADKIVPDPDDPGVAGCLLALLLCVGWWVATTVLEDGTHIVRASRWGRYRARVEGRGRTLGRACIAAVAALGRWPGGHSET